MVQQTPAGDGLPVHDAVLEGEDPWGLTHVDAPPQQVAVVFPTAAGLAHAEYMAPPLAPVPAHRSWSEAWPATPPAPPPAPAPTRSSSGRHRLGLLVLVALVVVAVLVGVAVGLSNSGSSNPPAPASATHHHGGAPTGLSAADRQLARSINLVATDVPATWSPDATSPFFSNSGTGNGSGPSGAAAAKTLENCLGIPSSQDPLSSSGNVPSVSSPPFKQPTSSSDVTEMQSQTGVLSADQVSGDLSVISKPQFASCFGQAMVTLFNSSSGTTNGAQVGTPHTSTITLEQVPGSRSVGVEISAPVSAPGGPSTTFDMQIVFIAGGRVETLLIGASVGQPFPLLVTAKASYDIEHRVAAEGSSSAA